MKFICKDYWTCVFKKQIDNLRTNHQVTLSSLTVSFKQEVHVCNVSTECALTLSRAEQSSTGSAPTSWKNWCYLKQGYGCLKVLSSYVSGHLCSPGQQVPITGSAVSRETVSGRSPKGVLLWFQSTVCLCTEQLYKTAFSLKLYFFLWDSWAQTSVTSHGSRLAFKDLNCKTSNITQSRLNGWL